MKTATKVVSILAALPLVIYAATRCCIDSSINCWNVYPGAISQYSWVCNTPLDPHHYVSSDFTVTNQPSKRWPRWIDGTGSLSYISNTVHCLAYGEYIGGTGFICREHYEAYRYACSGPVWPTGTGNGEMNAWPDGNPCPP